MSEELWPLPVGWRWQKAGEIAEIVGGGTPPASDESNFDDAGVPWVTPADLTGYEDTYIARGRRGLSKKGLASCGARMLPAGTVLYSSRAPIGYCAISSNPICTNQGFKSLVLHDGSVPEFVRYYLLASKEYAESLASGTTFEELSGSRMAEMWVPVAPATEQRRIVAKVDSLFKRSKIARDNLAHVPGLVERFKLAILAAAFRGDTTAKWRTAHATVRSNFLIEQATGNARKREGGNTAAESSQRFQLPETWRAAKVESIGEVILGRQRSPENHKGPLCVNEQ